MGSAFQHELHALPWRDPQPGAHVARGAAFICFSQAEAGVGCPITMTYAVVPALRQQPELAAEWEPASSRRPTTRAAPTAGKGRRHVRHGDDREAGRLRRPGQHHAARPVNGGGRRRVRLTGHKWFCPRRCAMPSCPRPGRRRLSCFLLPRWMPDGSATASACSASRTSSATARTPRARSSSTPPWPGGSARRAWGADDHRDGQPHAARLLIGGATAMRPGSRRRCTTPRTARSSAAADRAAADAERSRRPRARIRGGVDLVDAPRPRLDEASPATTSASSWRLATACSSTGSASAPRSTSRGLECLGGNGYVEESGCPGSIAKPAELDLGRLRQRPCLDVLRAMSRPRLGGGLRRRGRRGRGARAAARPLRRGAAQRPAHDPDLEARARPW